MHKKNTNWIPGSTPLSVILISLNEGHNMRKVLENLQGWASEVFLVDSYSCDDTLDIALEFGVKIIQRSFTGFGDQWNYAVKNLPISCPWVMKIDPDEIITNDLKKSISENIAIANSHICAFSFDRQLYFMSRSLPVRQEVLRVWRNGTCYFPEVLVNEHPIIDGKVLKISGILEHHDSPNLFHWLHKQNNYSSYEAIMSFEKRDLSYQPKLFGNSMERRMWAKLKFYSFPFRYSALFLYYFIFIGCWRSGKVGFIWSRLRCDVMRLVEYKTFEMKYKGKYSLNIETKKCQPDKRVKQVT